MNFKISFDSLFALVRSNTRVQSARSRSPKSRRLRLESLENRELLSATSWSDDASVPQVAICPVYEAPAESAVSGTQINTLSSTIDAALKADGQDPENLSQSYIFGLSSLPTSTYTIYLDFNGHVNSGGTYWQSLGHIPLALENFLKLYRLSNNLEVFS